MSRLRRSLLIGALAAWLALPAAAQTPAPLQMGVLPNVSSRIILTNYQPVRAYLSNRLGRPVEVTTAPDFRTFQARTVAGEYGLVVTAANLGRLAQREAGLVPVAIYEPAIPALLVAHRERRLGGPEALRGHTLALANPQSLVALRGLAWLKERGLVPGRDFQTVWARNEDSLFQILNAGDAPLAVMSMGEYRAIREDLRQSLDVFQEFAKVPNFLVLAGRGADADALREAVLGLPASPEGAQFFGLSGVRQIRAVTEAELVELDAVLDDTRAGLAAP